MKVGITVPNFGPAATADSLRAWAAVVEDAGFDFLMVGDHVAATPDVTAAYPGPFWEPLTLLGYLAGVTRRVELGTTVLVVIEDGDAVDVLDRNHGLGEVAAVPCLFGTSLRLGRVGVLVLAADRHPLGEVLGGDAHEDLVERVLQRALDGVEHLRRAHLRAPTRVRDPVRAAAHRLRATGQRDVGVQVGRLDHEQVRAGGAVDGAVVDHREDREPVGTALLRRREALDDVRDPQRVLAVHRGGDQPGDQLVQLVVRARRRDGAVPDVEVEVEVGVGDPVRVVEPERHLHQPASQRLELVDAVGELPAPGRVGLEVGVRSLEDQQLADVQELVVVLQVQERRVQTRELLHGGDLLVDTRPGGRPVCGRTATTANPTVPGPSVRCGRHLIEGLKPGRSAVVTSGRDVR